MIAKLLYNLSVLLGYKDKNRPTHETFAKQIDWMRIGAGDVWQILLESTNTELKTSFDNAGASYKMVNIDKLKMFVTENNLSKLVHEPERLGSNDFSYILQGDVSRWDSDLAFGIVWGVTPQGQGHAWNWCIGTDSELWFIDPQQNRVFKPEKLWKITLLIM